jgi:metal-responsive CopG/Arc/MetJ family transcriptional regulator
MLNDTTTNASAGRKVTRKPRMKKDPFFGNEIISTSVNKGVLNEIEETLKRNGLNRSEFIRHAVIRELAYHKFCNRVSVDPTKYLKVDDEDSKADKLAEIAKIIGG